MAFFEGARSSATSDGNPARASAAGRPSLDGVVRNLPAAVTAGALHPRVALPVRNPQGGPEENGIGVPVFALRRVTGDRRIERIEPNATVGGFLVEVLDAARSTVVKWAMDRTSWLADRRKVVEEQYTHEGPSYDDGYDPATAIHRRCVARLIATCPQGGAVLDAACGTAPYAGMVLDAGLAYVGTDQ